MNDLNFLFSTLKTTPALTLTLYNIITSHQRELSIILKITDQTIYDLEGLLGISFCIEQISTSLTKLIRITNIFPYSPASIANIVPMYDFIITSLNFDYQNLDQFGQEVEAIFLGAGCSQPVVRLVVYNCMTGNCRVCEIVCSDSWGGVG